MKRLFRYAGFVLAFVAAGVEAQDQGKPATPAEQYQALLKEFQTAAAAYFQTTNDAERQAIVARVDKATVRLLELVEKNPKEPFALERADPGDHAGVLVEHAHVASGLGPGEPAGQGHRAVAARPSRQRQARRDVQAGELRFPAGVRDVSAHGPGEESSSGSPGAACLRLAQLLAGRVEKLDLLKEQPELAQRYEGLFGKDYIEALQRRDRASVMKEAEALYEQASEKYGDVKLPYNETVGEVAKTDLFEIRHLAVGKVAPDIEGADQDGRPFKLSDYRGKVVLLYFWSEY